MGIAEITSWNNNGFSNSVIGEGLSVSHRFLPNEHHRVVVNVSPDSAGNLTHSCKNPKESNVATCVPSVYRQLNKFDQYESPVDEISLKQYQECQNNSDLLREIGRKESDLTFITDLAAENDLISDWKVFALAMSSLHGQPFGSILYSKVMKSSCMEFNFLNNLAESYSHRNMQILQQLLSISESGSHSFYTNTQAYSAEQGCTSTLMPRNKDFGPTCLWTQSPHIGSNQNELFLKDQYLQEQQMVSRHSNLAPRQSAIPSNVSMQMKNDMLLEQISHRPLQEDNVLNQSQEHSSFIENISTSQMSSSVVCESGMLQREAQLKKAHDVLLLYEHAKHCNGTKECVSSMCDTFKRSLCHILNCEDMNCSRQCIKYNALFNHYRDCYSSTCLICWPVKKKSKGISYMTKSETTSPTSHVAEYEQSSAKRVKVEHPAVDNDSSKEALQVSVPILSSAHPLSEVMAQVGQEETMSVEAKADSGKQVTQSPATSSFNVIAKTFKEKHGPKVETNGQGNVGPFGHSQVSENSTQENLMVSGSPKIGIDVKHKSNFSMEVNVTTTGMVKLKTKAISLLDTFTPEIIREHIKSLKNSFDQGKAKDEMGQAWEQPVDQNSCSLCGMGNLLFEPPARYCAICFKHINPKGVYYCMRSDICVESTYEANMSFCGKCYSTSGEIIKVGRITFRKPNLERRMNYAEADAETEWWVQCDKCESWQHQICALFNRKRKDVLQGEYICPNCYMQGIECGNHEPFLQNSILGAKDLPTTKLSNHLEQWLFSHLKQEREERACMLGKHSDEVPGAEGLIIRVVSSIDKNLEVNPLFHGIFEDENYPAEFPYKSKVILLFQNIDGSDVCLFAMYVQEYGSECPCPNQRRVCISYIDSVKYFRPEIRVVTGEALRTFVYHEILIGYLDYCKKRGFTSCYIWACPSLRQDYYILYCHPKVQKSPRPEKLREWYQLMIRKAMKENIIVEQTNLYDHFFVPKSECKVKVTAARLPYFDSDFWPGKADILLQKEAENEKQMKGTKSIIERAMRAAKRDFSTGKPKDILLMHQLGEAIRQIKEDFIIIHLQPECKHCCQPILSGKQWLCNACKNFQLCQQCYDKELNLEKKDRHPVAAKEKHSFQPAEVDVMTDTLDEDEIMQSEPFDMRTVFLSFCQSNQYQFDTLRRAKHSTMMILYHLHNEMASYFTSTCVGCCSDIITGQSWHCKTCSGYGLCDSCYRNGVPRHEHDLLSRISRVDHAVVQKQRTLKKQNVLDILVHASNCFDPGCTFFCCLEIKRLFLHGKRCKTRAKCGCRPCKKIWHILQLHVRACSDMECHVPRCKDLKNYRKQMRRPSGFLLPSSSSKENGKTRM